MNRDDRKAPPRTFDEVVSRETAFVLAGGRTLALRRMCIGAGVTVYSLIERVIQEAGKPESGGLLELIAFTCHDPSPRPGARVRVRRLMGLRDFSPRALARIITVREKGRLEDWLVRENLDKDLKEIEASRLADVKKNLQLAFAAEMERIQETMGTLPPETLERLCSIYSPEASAGLAGASASR